MATSRFIHYEIWPVCEDGQTGIVEICPTWTFASQMAFRTRGRPFWRLFGRCHSGSEVSVGDYFSFPQAAQVYQLITGMPAPEVEGAYHRLAGGDAQRVSKQDQHAILPACSPLRDRAGGMRSGVPDA